MRIKVYTDNRQNKHGQYPVRISVSFMGRRLLTSLGVAMTQTEFDALNGDYLGTGYRRSDCHHKHKELLRLLHSIEDRLEWESQKVMRGEIKAVDVVLSDVVNECKGKPKKSIVKGEISNEVIGKIDQHRGEMAKEVNDHIDNWVNEMSNVIIHNFFSEERKEKTLSIFDSTMELLTKTKKEQKSMNDFLQTVSMTICKLKKYRALIGPSIPISDMIERYVRVFKDAKVVSPDKKENFITKNLPKSLKKTFAFTSFGASSLASATSLASVTLATPFISVPIMVGSIVAGYYASTLLDNDRNAFVTLDIALDEYMNIANSYNPFNEQQQ